MECFKFTHLKYLKIKSSQQEDENNYSPDNNMKKKIKEIN